MATTQKPKEIRAERISVPERERNFPWAYFIAFAISTIVVGSGCYYTYVQYQQNNAQIQQYTERSFKKVNITIGDLTKGKLSP